MDCEFGDNIMRYVEGWAFLDRPTSLPKTDVSMDPQIWIWK